MKKLILLIFTCVAFSGCSSWGWESVDSHHHHNDVHYFYTDHHHYHNDDHRHRNERSSRSTRKFAPPKSRPLNPTPPPSRNITRSIPPKDPEPLNRK